MSSVVEGQKNPVGRRFNRDYYVDETAYEIIIIEKTRILREHPFWGIIALKLVWVEDTSGFVPTLGTDGLHVFYNAAFIKRLRVPEVAFAIAHELYHCVMKHCGFVSRRGDRDAQIWNIACDYITNAEIASLKIGEFITTIAIYHDLKYAGWSAEEVYEDLIQNQDQIPQQRECLDQHFEIEIVDDDGMATDGDEQDGGDDSRPGRIKMTREEYDRYEQEWANTIQQAVSAHHNAVESGSGATMSSLPDSIRRMISDLKRPRVNWKQALKSYVQRTIRRGYSYSTPNKKVFSTGITLPGFRREVQSLNLVVAVDTSGSITEGILTSCVSELNGMLGMFEHYDITAFCFQHNVVEESVTKITKRAGSNIRNLLPFLKNLSGGGGTSFEVIWAYMREQKMRPRVLVVLTDGYPAGGWGEPLYCPTIFLVVGSEGAVERPKAPFGVTLYYED